MIALFKKEFKNSLQFQFFVLLSTVLFCGSIALTSVLVLKERHTLRQGLITKGEDLASYMAKLSLDPLIMKNDIDLDVIVNEANNDKDIIFAVIQDARGDILTSPFASINYRSPRFKAILPEISEGNELPLILAALEQKTRGIKISNPIMSGTDTVGSITIYMSEDTIRRQAGMTVLIVIVANIIAAIILGGTLFIVSKKTILTPIIELSGAAVRLAEGDLSAQVTVKSTGEVQLLVDSFNQMARNLEKTTVSKNYVDNIIKSMNDALIVAAPDGTIKTVNQAACVLLGYREQELIGGHISKFLGGDEDSVGWLHEKILSEPVKNAECNYISSDGTGIPVLVSSSVIYSNDATPQGIVCVAVDITDRKRTEEKLKTYAAEIEQANEELRTFTYTVSHDLRAPLLNIVGFSKEFKYTIQEGRKFLKKYVPALSDEDKKTYTAIFEHDMGEAVEFIGVSVHRMDFLIESILKLSRLGRSELKPEPVRTERMVRTLLKTVQHQIESHNARVQVGPLPDLIIDPSAIERIFGNLLENALKYLEPSRPGDISITAEQSGGIVAFSIRDNGRGIAGDDLKKVFDPFRRVGNPNVPGEGMGLTYVKALIKRLGGRIWCESEPGVGTTFRFSVPIKPGIT